MPGAAEVRVIELVVPLALPATDITANIILSLLGLCDGSSNSFLWWVWQHRAKIEQLLETDTDRVHEFAHQLVDMAVIVGPRLETDIATLRNNSAAYGP